MKAHHFLDASLVAGTAALAVTGMPVPALAVAGAALALHGWAVFSPRSPYYCPVHWRLPPGATDFALTFDDGPHPEHTPAVLDALAAAGQQATFFVIGEHAAKHGALLRRALAEGHALGLHSHRHSRWFNCWPSGVVERDLRACAAAVADASGAPPPRLFRPPVGLRNPPVAAAVRRLGLVLVTWSARCWDTRGAPAERIAMRLTAAARPGAIVLLHDGCEPGRAGDRSTTVAGLKQALPVIGDGGLRSRALIADGAGIGLAPAAAPLPRP